MSAKHLSQIKQLFDQCEPLSQQHREQVLNQSTLDQAVVDEVKALLAIADSEQEHQATIISKQMMDMSQNMPAGQVLDVYQIDKEIGRGGMGIVFLAHRSDGAYQQKVAIKVSPSFASDEEQQRFQQERQILAKLQHPNIATLLGGGATEDKRPYIVMEYIEGQTLTQYCADKKLSLTARLVLFLDVCTAISYAHRHLVVHRDIKPENVLVNADGQVKLLDFGVGKVLQTSHLDHTQAFTTFSLAYASPEQVNGEATSTATDVYGLGALLYELLTGRPPHKIDNQNTEQIIKAICTQMPVKPSAVTKNDAKNNVQHTVNRANLKGDLDNVLAKALAKEPERRYASAVEFAQDIQHFLNGEAVIATPSSFSYQLKKLIQRHPITSGLSVALSSSVVLGLIVSLNLSNNLNIEKKKLEQEVATSEQVISLLTQMFDAASPSNTRGEDISVQELLKNAEEQTKRSLKDIPAVNARLLNVLATVQYKVGDEKTSAELRKTAFNLKRANQLAISAVDFAKLGKAHIMLGEFDLAKQAIDNALINVKNPLSFESALAHSMLGEYYRSQNKERLAVVQLKKAREILQAIDYPEDNWSLSIYRRMASTYDALGEFETAADVLVKAINKKQQLFGQDHPALINDNTELAFIYFKLGKTDSYLTICEANYHLARKYYDINNSNLNFVLLNYLNALETHGLFDKSLTILAENLVDELTNERSKGLLLNAQGSVYEELGLSQQALESFEASYDTLSAKWHDYLHLMFSVRFSRATYIGMLEDKHAGITLLTELEQQSIASWGEDTLAITSGLAGYCTYLLAPQ